MKKTLSMILAAAMITSVMAGCGTGTPSTTGPSTPSESTPASTAAPVELLYWDYHENAEAEFYKKYVDIYNAENPGVHITYETVPWDDYNGTKLVTAFASGAGPDIFQICPGQVLKYADSGVLAPLNDYIEPDVLKDFAPSAIEGVTVNGKILAIPYEIELLGLYYDVDVLKEAGVEPPKTWDELAVAAKKLKTDKRAGVTIETVKGEHQLFQWYPFLWMTGNDVYNADKTAAGINTQGVIDSLNLWRGMFMDGTANIKPSRPGSDIGILGDGETAMEVCGTWTINTLEEKYAGKNINVVPLPIPAGGAPASVAGGWKIAANAQSPHVEEASKFVTWLFAQDPARSLEWCTDVKFAYSPRKSVVDSAQEIYTKGARANFTNGIYGTEKPEMRLPAEISSILQDMLQSAYFDDKADVAAVVADAEKQINEFLATYEGSL